MVSIIIINFNQIELLKESIESIYKNFKFNFEIIVVNNSPEQDLSEIKEIHQDIRILESKNLGYSHANNLGVMNSNGDDLLFLNADTKIDSDIGEDLFELLNQKDTGAVGLKLLNEDGSFQLSFWNENNFFNEIKNKSDEKKFKARDNNFIKEIENEISNLKTVDWVSGAALMIKKNVFLKVGKFDEKFFLFYEDADLCKRLSDLGFKNFFYPFCRIMHYKGENVNIRFKNDTYYYSKESQIYYYKKHCTFLNRIALRSYLFFKFSFLYVCTFRKIYAEIILLTFGIKRNSI